MSRRPAPVAAARTVALALLALAAVASPAAASAPTLAHSASARLDGSHVFRAPGRVTHLAVYWRGARDAVVRLAVSRDGRHFGPSRRVALDEEAAARGGPVSYGALQLATGVRAVRVRADRALARLTVLWLDDRGRRVRAARRATAASVSSPGIISRAGWGADESLRYDSAGNEIWPPVFQPVQKLIVHHTDTQNGDPDPAATIRSIYYYHAVTQGWGDIGYNFLIDESGRVYEGRWTDGNITSDGSPAEEDSAGHGVTAAHAQGFNSGTVGIALLGTLTSQDATPAARSALEQLLAYEGDRHGIDPLGSSLYTNPVNGTQATFPNIAGHRDVNATACPGDAFYATLPSVRTDVAAMLGMPVFSLSAAPATATVARGKAASYAISVTPQNGFTGAVTLSATGLPSGATASFAPNPATTSSTLTVKTSRTAKLGTFTLTIAGDAQGRHRQTTVALQVVKG